MIFKFWKKGELTGKDKELYEMLQNAANGLKDYPKMEFERWPTYPHEVLKVLGTMSDVNYPDNYEKIKDKPIEKMSIKDISTMYTFIRRGERFCDGHIAGFIEDGTLYKLVLRHLELLKK